MVNRIRLRFVFHLMIFAVVYWLAAKFSLWVGSHVHYNASAFWLPTGIAYWVMLTRGNRFWPGVLLGAMAATWSAGVPLPAALGVGIGNTLEALVACLLLRRIGFDPAFVRLRDVRDFFLCGILVAPAISAVLGVFSLHLAGIVPTDALKTALQVWWVGDATSAIVLTPLLLTWRSALPLKSTLFYEIVMLTISVIAVGSLLIFSYPMAFEGTYPIKFLLFPLLIWGAIRFGIPGSALVIMLMQAVALSEWSSYGNVWLTTYFTGFILPVAQAYFAVAATIGLIIAVVLRERHHLTLQSQRIAQQLDGVLATAQSGVMALTSIRNATGAIEDFRWEFCNKVVEPLTGHAAKNLLGRRLLEFFPDDLENGLFARYVRVVESGVPEHFEHYCQHSPTGSWYQITVAKLNDGFVMTFSDVSQFKETFSRMVLAEKVFEHSGEAITITDGQNNILRVNPAFTATTGYSAEEVIGKNPRLLSSGRNGPEFYRQMWQALRADGHWEGEIWNRRKNGHLYPEWLSINTVQDANNNITQHIAIFSDISDRKSAEDRIQFLANYDDLTQLPNRSLLRDRLNQSIAFSERNRQHFALIDIDIDNLKLVNDSLGNTYGDVALQTIGERIKACLRETDTVARYSGDEFMVLLNDTSTEMASHLAQKIHDVISQPYYFADHEVALTACIGISIYPVDGDDASVLLRSAQSAMTAATKLGPGNIQFFTQNMNAGARERLHLINSLRHALGRNQFELYYQPQVDIKTGTFIGKEALIRWHHPDLGLVTPGDFIPLAEESGMIIPIGEWVLHEACRQNVADQRAGLPPITIAVNLSALQFRQHNLPGMIAKTLTDTGMEGRWLEVEVTESVVMHDMNSIIAMLAEIRSMGVEISIDDFGTGFSSLSYLKHLPIDKLKIDQSFVRDMVSSKADAAIVRAVITLANTLGLRSIAEGVESEQQQTLLTNYGCNEGQGFYFGKPMPANAFAQLLAEQVNHG